LFEAATRSRRAPPQPSELAGAPETDAPRLTGRSQAPRRGFVTVLAFFFG